MFGAQNGNAGTGSGGGLFGTNASGAGGGLFGNAQPVGGTSLFSTSQAPPSGGLFASAQPTTGGGLFGSTNNQNTTGTGSQPNSTTSTTSGGLFGNNTAQPSTTSGGLFGNNTLQLQQQSSQQPQQVEVEKVLGKSVKTNMDELLKKYSTMLGQLPVMCAKTDEHVFELKNNLQKIQGKFGDLSSHLQVNKSKIQQLRTETRAEERFACVLARIIELDPHDYIHRDRFGSTYWSHIMTEFQTMLFKIQTQLEELKVYKDSQGPSVKSSVRDLEQSVHMVNQVFHTFFARAASISDRMSVVSKSSSPVSNSNSDYTYSNENSVYKDISRSVDNINTAIKNNNTISSIIPQINAFGL